MTNCLEWLPVYFGILKTGALAVPLNFRFTSQEIKKCLEAVETKALIYGPEFIERIDEIVNKMDCVESYIFVGKEIHQIMLKAISIYCKILLTVLPI